MYKRKIYSYLLACLIWAAIRSRSLRPWDVSFRPPLASFSTSFSCSKACSPLRAILPEPRLQWLGQLPLLRRTENSKFISYIKTLHRFLGKHGLSVCGVKLRRLQMVQNPLGIHMLIIAFLFTPSTCVVQRWGKRRQDAKVRIPF